MSSFSCKAKLSRQNFKPKLTKPYCGVSNMGRTEWLQERKKGIGGSDAAAILGLNPYMSNVDLWEIKTGRKEQEDISEKEIVTLIKNFSAIKDPTVRKSIITLAKTLSKKEEESENIEGNK